MKKHSFKPLEIVILMLRSIAQTINLKNGRKNTTRFLRSLFTRLTFGYLWHSCSTAYAVNDNSKKENNILWVCAFIRVEFASFTEELTAFNACAKCDFAKSIFEFTRTTRAKNFSSTRLIFQKLTR